MLEQFGGSQEALRKELGVSRGVVGRWLYGDGVPDVSSCIAMQTKIGIAVAAWHTAPAEPFEFPPTQTAPPESAPALVPEPSPPGEIPAGRSAMLAAAPASGLVLDPALPSSDEAVAEEPIVAHEVPPEPEVLAKSGERNTLRLFSATETAPPPEERTAPTDMSAKLKEPATPLPESVAPDRKSGGAA